MDEIKNKYPNIYIIFTTNYREKIDKALLSRCTVQIPFELPTSDIIKDLFGKTFKEIKQSSSDNQRTYIELIKDAINKKNTEEKKFSPMQLINETGNYDQETYDFWFGVLDFELNKTHIEIEQATLDKSENKVQILQDKKKFLENYKKQANEEKNFFHFLGVLAHLHGFNLRDINSLIEKRKEVKDKNDFIKLFSDKIESKRFIKRTINARELLNIKNQIRQVSIEELERKITILKNTLVYSSDLQENN